MALLWIVFLALDIVLMGGAYYFLSRGKKANPAAESAHSDDSGKRAEENAAAASVLAELKEELAEVRKTSAYLEKKRAQFEVFERSLHEKNARLEELIRKAEESAVKIELTESDIVEDDIEVDTYSRAAKMLSKGVPVEDVVKDLGILSGEARLLSSLNAYRQ
jgi:uncharacterized protein DUF2802